MDESTPTTAFGGLTKALCIVVVALVLAATIYAAVVVVQNYGQILV